MNDTERCDNCRFFGKIKKKFRNNYPSGAGACFRYPPIQDNDNHYWGDPPVKCNTWCGEWEVRWQAVDAPEPPTVKSPPC